MYATNRHMGRPFGLSLQITVPDLGGLTPERGYGSVDHQKAGH